MAQAGGMDPFGPGPNPPSNVPLNVPLNVPNSVGGLGVSPPLGGVTPPTNTRARERDFERDFAVEEKTKIIKQLQPDTSSDDDGKNGTLNGTMGQSNVLRDILARFDTLWTEIILTRRRAEHATLVCVQMQRRFIELERLILQQPPPPKMPLPVSGPAYARSNARVVAAEDRKDALLMAGASSEGLLPLDLPALDKADEEFEEAMSSHLNGDWKNEERPPHISEAVKIALERGYLCAIRAATEPEKWNDLQPVTEVQKAALDEIYLQALRIAADNEARAFALFMVWCEECAADKRHHQPEKSPRHMLLSSDLCSTQELGPESSWWTIERVNSVWQSQTEVSL